MDEKNVFLRVIILLIFLVFIFLFELSSLMIELLRLEFFEVLPWNMILGKLGTVSALIPNLKQLQLIIVHFFNTRCGFAFFLFFFIYSKSKQLKILISLWICLVPLCSSGELQATSSYRWQQGLEVELAIQIRLIPEHWLGTNIQIRMLIISIGFSPCKWDKI